MASDTYALRQAVWKHEDAVQMHHAGDKSYEHVQAWRDAVVSAAMDMRDAAVARALAAERARVVEALRADVADMLRRGLVSEALAMEVCLDTLPPIGGWTQDAAPRGTTTEA